MKLKQYQTDTLAVLQRFLEEARVAGPKNAYDNITREPEQAKRLGRYRTDYTLLDGMPGDDRRVRCHLWRVRYGDRVARSL